MTPMHAIKSGLAKSFHFSGRASRSEFWWFACFCLVAGFLATWLDFSANSLRVYLGSPPTLIAVQSGQSLGKFWAVASTIMLFSVALRRLGDAKQMKVPLFISVFSSLILLYLLFTDYFGLAGASGGIRIVSDMPSPTLPMRGFVLAISIPVVIPILSFWWLLKPTATDASMNLNEAGQ